VPSRVPFRFLALRNDSRDGYEMLDGTPESVATSRAARAAWGAIEAAALNPRSLQRYVVRLHRELSNRERMRPAWTDADGKPLQQPFLRQGEHSPSGGYASDRIRQKARTLRNALVEFLESLPAVPTDPAQSPLIAAIRSLEAIQTRAFTAPDTFDRIGVFAGRFGRHVHDRLRRNVRSPNASVQTEVRITIAVMRACYPTEAKHVTADAIRKRIERNPPDRAS
jgi:hypothetical protein